METAKPQFPLVSIVVPCWNEENFISSCLVSIKNQTFHNFEVIIVDDGSTDRTPEMIESVIADDPRFQYHRLEKNSGTGTALNFGFERASGSYWTWVAGDSAVEPEFLEEQVAVLNASPSDVILTYSDWYIQDDVSNEVKPVEVPEYNKKHLQVLNYVGPCNLFRREAKLRAGPYCGQICEDYYMHLVMSEFGRFVRVPKSLGMWRNHPNNLTNRVSLKSKWMEGCIAKAKARWKVAQRRVAYVCPAFDCAQRGWLLMNTINDHSGRYAMRHIALYETSGQGPFDATPHALDEVHDILNDADILMVDDDMCDTAVGLNMLPRIKNTPTILRVRSDSVQPNVQKLLHLMHHYKVRLSSCAPGHPLVKWMPNPIPFNTNPKWHGRYESYYHPPLIGRGNPV